MIEDLAREFVEANENGKLVGASVPAVMTVRFEGWPQSDSLADVNVASVDETDGGSDY